MNGRLSEKGNAASVVVGRLISTRALLIVLLLVALPALWLTLPEPVPTTASVAPAPPAASLTKGDSKISQILSDAVVDYEDEGEQTAGNNDRRSNASSTLSEPNSGPEDSVADLVRFDDEGRVQVYIRLESSSKSNRQDLEDLGAEIEVVDKDSDVVQAWAPTSALSAIETLENVLEIIPPDYGVTRAGSVTTEGDAILRGNLVRTFSTLTGAGVRVGVISNGADTRAADAQATNDLPMTIEIDPTYPGSEDEGTAMMEIIHDIAPGASLAFSGPSTSVEFLESVAWLADDAFGGDGADIIVDDWGFFAQPYFEDGPVAKKVDEVAEDGVIYVTAAGNEGDEHYTGTFSKGAGDFHEFSPGDISLRLYSRSGRGRVFLQWNDEFGKSGTDYDLYACEPGLEPTRFNLQNELCTRSAGTQDGDDNPWEYLITPPSALIADIYIQEYENPAGSAKVLKLYAIDSFDMEYSSAAGSVFAQAAASGAIAVGAIHVNDPGLDHLESYSSRGPAEIYFPSRETRTKPDIVATTGVSVTGAGTFPSYFPGTSAAAPHAAGVAALILQAERIADNTRSRENIAEAVRNRLKDNAADLGAKGVDNNFGAGRLDALTAAIATGELDSIFQVDSTGDGADDDITDGGCDDGSGNCTLRAAIQEINAGSGGVITFGISGNGPHTIQPATALPTITKTVFIDGLSQNGAAIGTIKIELDGTNAGASTNGLELTGAESLVRGLAVNRFGGHGIVVQTSDDQIVEDNYLGTDPAGTTDRGNGGAGLYVSGVSNTQIRYNLISGNTSHGIVLSGAEDTAVVRNKVGVTSGGSAMGNDGAGIHIENGTSFSVVQLNEIANNGGDGVAIVSDSATANSVRGNSIYSNTGLGIDLGDDGVTANDDGDMDTGPNGNYNFPTLTAVARNGAEYEVRGTLNAGTGGFVMDVYSNDSCDASGNGEGQTYLGSKWVYLNSSDTFIGATVDDSVGSFGRTVGNNISVTASQSGSFGSISEFSICLAAGELPVLDLSTEFVTVTEGSTGTYLVKLTEQPSTSVTVEFTGDTSKGVTVSPPSMTFSATNWNTAGTATVSAGTDSDPLGFQTEITHTVTINSKPYVGTPVTVVVQDKDTEPRMSVSNTDFAELIVDDATVIVIEGNQIIYKAKLTQQPASDVVISLEATNAAAVRINPSALTFTPSNWNTAQDVTVVANIDSDDVDELVWVEHKRPIGGVDYIVGSIVLYIDDFAQPQPLFSEPNISVNEGQTSTYELSLVAPPETEVKLVISSNDQEKAIVWPREFYFTPLNWATGRTVTVTGVLDTNTDDESTVIWHYWQAAGGTRLIGQFAVNVTDQSLPFLNLSRDVLEIREGSDDTYTVAMAAAPTADVTVSLSSLDTSVATLSPASIDFTTTNWNTAIPVTVTAASDADDFDEAADIRHEITQSSTTYVLATLTAKILEAGTNESPAFTEGDDTDRELREDAPRGSNVGDAVEADDPEADTLTYILHGGDAGFFNINSATGQISLRNSTTVNYESKDRYSVSVSVYDGKDADDHQSNAVDDTINVEIKVENVNETGTLTLSPATPNTQVASVANLTDPDGSVSSAVWEWHTSQTGADPWTLISGANAGTYMPSSTDVGMYLRVSVTYADTFGSGQSLQTRSTNRVVTPASTPTTPTTPPTAAPDTQYRWRRWRRRGPQESLAGVP